MSLSILRCRKPFAIVESDLQKDRRERVLEFEDILHYQKIIVALSETDKLMQEIKGIEIE